MRLGLTVLALLSLAACGGDQGQPPADPAPTTTVVVASNYPVYYMATRIADGVAGAQQLVLPEMDGDPAFWTPTDEQIVTLQQADVILINGAGAEPWIDLVTLEEQRLVDTSAGADLIPLETAVAHRHGPEGEHAHEGTAHTTWLDPRQATTQADVIANALAGLDPGNESTYRANADELKNDLAKLDVQLAEVMAQLGDRAVLFSHPVYQYLERRYGINGASVHWEPGEAPSTAAWIELQQVLASHPATIMIWEDEPLPATASRLADAGIRSIVFHTAANRPEQGDYLMVMRANVDRLAGTL